MADKKMKSLLQMCALSAIKYDPQLKENYKKQERIRQKWNVGFKQCKTQNYKQGFLCG